jgi:flotillin
MDSLLDTIVGAGCAGLGIGIGLLMLLGILKQFLFVGRPNEVLIFSGRTRKLADGSTIGYREIIAGGRALRIPLLEKVDRMSLVTLPVDIRIANAYSKGGIPLTVHAIANVKISSNPTVLKNAVERFLGRDLDEVRRVAKETLEGHVRGVLATLTPEEVNEDRLKFANALVHEAEDDFNKLGLELDTLKVQNVQDEVTYLDSIGRKRIAEVIRDAEVAESTAVAEAERAEASSHQLGEVAVQTAQTSIIQQENALRELTAELAAEVQSEEELALAAAQQARAEAETKLQEIRKELEELRLMADVVLPAQASRDAARLQAQGDAATIEENGTAMAQVVQSMTETWLKAGQHAEDIFLIQQLEEVIGTIVEQIQDLDIRRVKLVDGGDGQALPRHVASYPGMVRQVLEELKNTTGVNVTGILSGREG